MKWTEADIAYLREHYAHAGPAQCARILGRPHEAVLAKANYLGLATRAGKHTTVREALIAAASGPTGFRICELVDVPKKRAEQLVQRMRGITLFPCHIGHKHTRYFASAAAALAYMPKAQQHQAAPASVTFRHKPGRAWWPADAEPIITSETKITIVPTPPPALRTNTHDRSLI